MLETFTPAVCGSRKRQIAGQSLFAVSAVLRQTFESLPLR